MQRIPSETVIHIDAINVHRKFTILLALTSWLVWGGFVLWRQSP